MSRTLLMQLPWSRRAVARALTGRNGRDLARQAARLLRAYARRAGVSVMVVNYSLEG